MDTKNTGGPAFPTSDHQAAHAVASVAIEGVSDAAERDRLYTAARAEVLQGMSLRDYFAAHAPITIADVMLSLGVDPRQMGPLLAQDRVAVLRALAKVRGEYADAMIEARAK